VPGKGPSYPAGVVPLDRLAAFVGLAFALIVVPGPSVLFVISRGVALGRRAAVTTVVGNAAGVYVQVVAVALGIGALVERSVLVFRALSLVGAAYLVVLGVRTVRGRRRLAEALEVPVARASTRRILREGFLVGLANPKVIVFFAAVLPQFTDPARGHVPVQLLVLGAIFVGIALLSDSAWGVAAGSVREWLARSPRRLAALGGTGGLVMVALGLRLAVTGRER
jgi:threonine/homoserine/homoserine lactone efflux protein